MTTVNEIIAAWFSEDPEPGPLGELADAVIAGAPWLFAAGVVAVLVMAIAHRTIGR